MCSVVPHWYRISSINSIKCRSWVDLYPIFAKLRTLSSSHNAPVIPNQFGGMSLEPRKRPHKPKGIETDTDPIVKKVW